MTIYGELMNRFSASAPRHLRDLVVLHGGDGGGGHGGGHGGGWGGDGGGGFSGGGGTVGKILFVLVAAYILLTWLKVI